MTLSAASGKTVTVDYATADGTATSPADYTSAAGTLTFAPGVITRTFTVPVVGDTLDELDETFVVNLSNPTNATIADGQGVGTITDNDAIPTLSIDNVTVTEGDAGTATATFTVTLSAASGKTVTVDYATANGTATSPADYTAASGTLTFTPGQTTKTIDVAVQGDLLDEVERDVHGRRCSNPDERDDRRRHAAPAPSPTTTPCPRSSINDVSVTEGNAGTTNADFTVTLSAPSGRNRHGELRHGQRHRDPARRLHDDLGHAHVHPGPDDEDGRRSRSSATRIDEIDETFVVNLHGARERDDRRHPGRRDDHRRRPAALDHDQRRRPSPRGTPARRT